MSVVTLQKKHKDNELDYVFLFEAFYSFNSYK